MEHHKRYRRTILWGIALAIASTLVGTGFWFAGRPKLQVVNVSDDSGPSIEPDEIVPYLNGRRVAWGAGTPFHLRIPVGRLRVRLERKGFQAVIWDDVRAAPFEAIVLDARWEPTSRSVQRRRLDRLKSRAKEPGIAVASRSELLRRDLQSFLWELSRDNDPEGRSRNEALGLLRQLSDPLSRRVLTSRTGNKDLQGGRYEPKDPVPSLLWSIGSNKLRHVGPVNRLAIDPAGEWVASGGADGQIVWHGTNDGTRISVGNLHHAPISAMAVTPDGQSLVSADQSGNVLRWDARDSQPHQTRWVGRQLATVDGHVRAVALNHRGTVVAMGGQDQTLRCAAMDEELPTRTWHHHRPIESIRFSPDDQLIAVAGTDSQVVLLDSVDLSVRHRWDHPRPVMGMFFSENGRQLSVADKDRVFVWDVATGDREYDYEPARDILRWADDGKWRAEVHGGGNLQRISLHQGKWKQAFPLDGRLVRSVAYRPEVDLVVVGTTGGEILVKRASDGTTLASPGDPSEKWNYVAHDASLERLAVASKNGTARLLDLFDRKVVASLPGMRDRMESLWLSGVGQCIVRVTSDTIRIDSIDGSRSQVIRGGPPSTLSQDHRFLVFVRSNSDSTALIVHDLERRTERPLAEIPTVGSRNTTVTALLAMPKEDLVVVGRSDGNLLAVSWRTGRIIWDRYRSGTWRVGNQQSSFDSAITQLNGCDGGFVSVSDQGQVVRWKVNRLSRCEIGGRILVDGDRSIRDSRLSIDGAWLWCAGKGALWRVEMESGNETRFPLDPSVRQIRAIEVGADPRRVFVVPGDGRVRVHQFPLDPDSEES